MLFSGVTRALLSLLLVTAALWDIRKRRIPNILNAAVLFLGLFVALIDGGWRATLSGAGATLLTVALCWVPWTRGLIGGGDVKLAAACSAWIGLGHLHEYLLATALLGAVVAVVCYALSKRSARKEMAENLRMAAAGVMPQAPIRGGDGRVSVPYGVACAAAALLVVLLGKGW